MMFPSFSDIFYRPWSTRSPRKMSRFAILPLRYNPPIVVKPPKPLHRFTVKGHTIMAFSRKDAIKRLKRQKLI